MLIRPFRQCGEGITNSFFERDDPADNCRQILTVKEDCEQKVVLFVHSPGRYSRPGLGAIWSSGTCPLQGAGTRSFPIQTILWFCGIQLMNSEAGENHLLKLKWRSKRKNSYKIQALLANTTREGFHRSGETFPTRGKEEACGVWGKRVHFCLAEWEMTWCVRESHTLGCCLSQETQLLGISWSRWFLSSHCGSWRMNCWSLFHEFSSTLRLKELVWTYIISQTSGLYVPAQSLMNVLLFLSGMDLVPQHGVMYSSVFGAKCFIVSLSKLQGWGRSSHGPLGLLTVQKPLLVLRSCSTCPLSPSYWC